MSRNILTNLLASTTTSYDKTKTFLAGNAYLKTIGGKSALGPPLTKFVDYQTDFGGTLTPFGFIHPTTNNRKFVLGNIAAGVITIGLYNIDPVTKLETAVGKIEVTLPNAAATVHTPKWVRAVDTGTTGWKIFLGTTASVAINGGVFTVNKVDLADFTMGVTPTRFYMAIASDVRGVYFNQDTGNMGASHIMTTVMGGTYNPTIAQALFTFGTAATFQMRGIDPTIAPTIATQTATANTTAAGTVHTLTGHGYASGDQIVITANPPTNYTASTGAATQVVYFVRATVTANTFELSATSGGTAIVTGTAVSPTYARAFGQTSAAMIAARKSGVITSGFAGTALLLDCQQSMTPVDGPNAGTLCYFFPTTTNFYCFPLASLTAGVTSLAGSTGIDNLDNGTEIVAPTTVVARYSETIGKIVYATAAFSFIAKAWVNSNIFAVFGTQINTLLENSGRQADYFRGSAISGISTMGGFLHVGMTTVGQRGSLVIDMRSDTRFDYSYVISPVTYAGDAFLKYISTIEELYELTDTVSISIRSAATAADSIFNTAAGGWVALDTAADLSSVAIGRYFQIKANFDTLSVLSGVPTQLADFIVGVQGKADMSEKWTGDANNTSAAGATPAHIAFRQAVAYGAPVALRATGVDDNGNAVTYDTDTQFSFFEKTSNSGTSWTPMSGANDYPNVALTSGIRVNPTGLAAINYTWGLMEK